jgi:hypothetical protein
MGGSEPPPSSRASGPSQRYRRAAAVWAGVAAGVGSALAQVLLWLGLTDAFLRAAPLNKPRTPDRSHVACRLISCRMVTFVSEVLHTACPFQIEHTHVLSRPWSVWILERQTLPIRATRTRLSSATASTQSGHICP